MFGLLNINKKSGMTSHKVISILRKITGIKQIGHAGTLDPLASGVLPVAIGKASKLIDFLPQDKAYAVSMYLGMTSDTYDIEGEIVKNDYRKIELDEIKKVIKLFKGKINQIPPAYSAVHYNGKRLYELARKANIPDDIPSRKVNIYKNDIISFDYEKQILQLYIECSKGTYIRSIVNDIGIALNCGAVMFELKRTKSSGLLIDNSFQLDDDTTISYIENKIINPISFIDMPKISISDNELLYLNNGNKFKNRHNVKGNVLLIKEDNIIALAEAGSEFIQPKKVLL